HEMRSTGRLPTAGATAWGGRLLGGAQAGPVLVRARREPLRGGRHRRALRPALRRTPRAHPGAHRPGGVVPVRVGTGATAAALRGLSPGGENEGVHPVEGGPDGGPGRGGCRQAGAPPWARPPGVGATCPRGPPPPEVPAVPRRPPPLAIQL